jgi:Zn-dependent protease with chaperone function
LFALPVAIPQPSPEAIRLYQTGNVLWMVETLWGLLVPAVIFFSGSSARLRDAALRVTRRWYAVVLIYFALFALILDTAQLPLDYYAYFVRPHAYGLSAQTLAKWWRDEFTGFGLALVGGALLIWIPYALLRRAPQRWWLYCWLASIPISFGIAFVEPIWVEPLFNDFAPMRDSPLKTRIIDLAARAGIGGARVFVVNKSVDTNESNAYVTGIGSTTRIVLWDTIIEQSTPDELVATMGHEMGHFVLGHVWSGLLLASAGILLVLRLIDVSASAILKRYAGPTGVREKADVGSMPLFVLLVGVFLLAARPAVLAFVRHQEHEADRFGLEITHDNHACATSFVRFVQHDLAYPSPGSWYVFWRSTHPPIAERIAFCNDYHPWLDGAPERYSGYFTR